MQRHRRYARYIQVEGVDIRPAIKLVALVDAAFGEPPQRDLLARLLGDPGAPAVQLGGGLRDRSAVEWAFGIGCSRVVIGSMLERDFALLATLANEHPGRVVVALDVRGDSVRLDGWRRAASGSLDEICAGYTDTELELLAGFLRRTTDAGQSAAAALAPG